MKISEMKDLWIGDKLIWIPGGRICRFEGLAGEEVRIELMDKKLMVSPEELRPVEGENEEDYILQETLEELEKPHREIPFYKLHPQGSTIDLHIEKLFPEYEHAVPERILQLQRNACEEFVQKAIDAGLQRITIIHGKGKGVLKTEVLHILKSFAAQISLQIPIHDGGGLEIWLR